jgi:SET domain-containing protein
MKIKLFQNNLIVKKSSLHGYGVFAAKTIKKGELIEECYMLVTNGGDRGLEDFYFDVNGKYGIFTGFGSIYNHSDDPNADYVIKRKMCIVTIKAIKTIPKEKEIFITYGNEWFSSRGRKARIKTEK